MTAYQSLADILDETFSALSSFDLDKLQALECRIALLVESNFSFEADEIRSAILKKRQLEILLQNCQVNLDALSRLHLRSMGNQWAQ